MLLSSFLLLGAAPLVLPAAAQDRENLRAWRATKQGRILPLREIERRVVPTMKDAQYIGFDLEMPSGIYTLKFLRGGNVIWIDVDGRSGQIIGRTGK
jgi:hypothetical protein